MRSFVLKKPAKILLPDLVIFLDCFLIILFYFILFIFKLNSAVFHVYTPKGAPTNVNCNIRSHGLADVFH